jgi:pyridoxamine 5'-phosphate oxidase
MKKVPITHLRREYRYEELVEKNIPSNPIPMFKRWFQEALKAKVLDVNALALASISASGKPSNRIVLLKGLDSRGFTFFTNYESRKGKELRQKPVASLLFFWPQLSRQIRIDGKVSKVSTHESDVYFKTRPRGSQLGAWASNQSQTVPNREYLEARMRALEEQFAGKTIPRPPYWGGFRLVPNTLEFWQGRPNRLHDRLQYQRKGQGGWKISRLAP